MTTTGRRGRGPITRAAAVAGAAAMVALIALPTTAAAATAPGLGTAANFAVLAGTPKITNTGLTTISGSLGISPAAAVTGFPPGTVSNGTIEAATPVASTAKSDLTAAFGAAASSPCNFNETNLNLGGLTLTPGTYCQTTAPTLTGTLTLSGNGVFIFQLGSTLVTATGATVVLTNGAQPCNVFWQVSSSATINTTSSFVGTIMALTDITISNGAVIAGRALARNGTVTMINDNITAPTTCLPTTVSGPPPVPTTGGAGSGPQRGIVLLVMGVSVVLLSAGSEAAARRRRRRSAATR